MLLTDKQVEQWVEWFKETYKNDAPIEADGRMWIPIIYSDNPEQTEEEHKEMRKNKLRELMKKNYDKKYIHRGWREDTYWNAQFNSIWLYNGPIFKWLDEKWN